MMRVDYAIDQAGENFTIRGDWPGEIMGLTQDGKYKGNHLYKPGGKRFLMVADTTLIGKRNIENPEDEF